MKKEDLIFSSQNAPYAKPTQWFTLSLEPSVFAEESEIKYLCRRYYADLVEYRPCITRFDYLDPATRFNKVLDDFVDLNVKSPVLDYNPLLCCVCLRRLDGSLVRKFAITEVI